MSDPQDERKDSPQNPEPAEAPDGQPQESGDPHEMTGKVSAFRSAWEIEAAAKRKAELEERERQKKEAEFQEHAREEYAKELAGEKVDLIRLKQGVITEEDMNFPEEEEKHYTIWQRIGNWFYHAKWWLGIAVFVVLVAAFLTYDYFSRVDGDVRIMLLTEQPQLYVNSDVLCGMLGELCPDFNGDGKQIVQSVYIPVSKESMEQGGTYAQSYNTQLLMQFQSAACMLVICDSEAETYLQPEEMFTDLSALYPDCPLVDGYRIRLNDTDLAERLGMEAPFKEDSYLALRTVSENMNSLEENQQAHDEAKQLLDALVPTLHEKEAQNG